MNHPMKIGAALVAFLALLALPVHLGGYWEYWAQNRLEGYALFATLSIPLGSAGK